MVQEHPNPTVALHPWQRDALAAWRDNGHLGVVQAVTGAGKTRVGLAALREAWRRGKRTVVDECPRYGVAEFSRVLDDRYDWRLGLTATYARTPASGL